MNGLKIQIFSAFKELVEGNYCWVEETQSLYVN